MSANTQQKIDKLQSILAEMESVVIAFSGGVDSTFLLKVAYDVLKDKALAVTATSSTYPSRELEEAKQLAGQIGAPHIIVPSEELDIEGFTQNPPNRCYYCKRELFTKLLQVAQEHGIKYVADGSNADDLKDHRPGMQAARELGVRSPLQEAGLRKDDIRQLSRVLGLPTWDKPSLACLSSRFPYGTVITRDKLARVEAAETFLRTLGFRQLRVRHHEHIARIEIPANDFLVIIQKADQIVAKFKELGYNYVTLDLEGYRTGSMNEVLGVPL